MATSLLLIGLSVGFWTCRKPEPELVPIGAVRVVGRIENGVAVFEPEEDPLGRYNIVTPAFVLKFVALEYKVIRLNLEIRRLNALIEKGK